MTNREKYIDIFSKIFEVEPDKLPGLTYNSISSWDSVGHMALVTNLENTFDIMLDTDDILNLNSFEKGMEILGKYDIQF